MSSDSLNYFQYNFKEVNMYKSIKSFLAAALVMSTVAIFAQTGPDISGQNASGFNAIQTAVPFMRISPDARSGAMGDVGIAISPDANAVFWNSAKLPFIEDQTAGISLSYTPWLASLDVNDIHVINANGYYKLSDDQAVSGSIRYFSLGETSFRETATGPEVLGNPQEFAIQAGYSRKLSDVFGLGVNLKYINSDLADGQIPAGGSNVIQAGNSVAGDINTYFNPDESGNADWAFGATLSNLGAKISYVEESTNEDFLPTNFGLGASVGLNLDEINKLSFALDANKLLVPTPDGVTDNSWREESVINSIFSSWGDAPGGFSEELKEFQMSLGAEYDYNQQFFGRAGYFYENDDKGGRQYATLGAGLQYKSSNFNFAYLFATNNSQSPLDKTLRFSVNFDIQ